MKDTDRTKKKFASISTTRGLLLGLALAALVALGLFAGRQHLAGDGSDTSAAHDIQPAGGGGDAWGSIGGPFTLVDEDGKMVTDQDFRGKWLLVYFGYTYCPDVCPTSLARNAGAIDLLNDKGKQVVPVLITVDPQRDTPENLKDYVHSFHPRMVGLSGTPEQIAQVAREYRVFYMKPQQADDTDYLVDHSSLSYLIGPDGRFVRHFSHQASPQQVADQLNKLL